ncbi:DUF177 domain-containing protein, partial [Eubacteriales bacterium OttesenSCG-928-N13]|nr:DUF177 domain-containing protein [Eubacteriales bacterium OttesenSCG-928-N13]
PVDCALVLPTLDVLDDQLTFDHVQLRGTLVGAGESVRIQGKASAMVHAHCAKCLEPVSQQVLSDLDETFTKTPNPEDPDQRPLDGYEIQLDDLVSQALLLELPMRFLCKADCEGLCPVCGINRNQQRCTCQEGGPSPFSALSVLLSDDEEV